MKQLYSGSGTRDTSAEHPTREAPALAVWESCHDFIEINAKHASEWSVVNAQKGPLLTADEAATEEDKRDQLDPTPSSN